MVGVIIILFSILIKKAEKKITQKSAFNLIQDEQNDLLAFFLFFFCVYNLDTQNPFFNEQKTNII